MRDGDTIAALSSGALPAGVAVIRLSGPQVPDLLERLAGGVPEPRKLALRQIGADTWLDRGLVAYFPAPHSFTGEHCAELQVHGSPAGVRAILKLLVQHGVRLAEAGEFTRRAFENGKLDLVTIEGLGDLLEAETENQRQQALDRLEGGLTRQLDSWREQLLDLRAELEARLDFSDEGDVDELPESFSASLVALRQDFEAALTGFDRGRLRREGVRVALAGPPNAGKSSLINALSRSDVAIVTDEAGTTRDVREVPLDLGGQLFILLDLAGLRETDSKAEAEGVRRAEAAIAGADLVLWLVAPDLPEYPAPSTPAPLWRIGTKSDLGQATQVKLALSTQTGSGVDILLNAIEEFGADMVRGEPVLVSRERDRQALLAAVEAVREAERVVAQPELAAESLRRASHALERLLGRLDPERVLDQLFSRFCIGK
ncbi:tRNA uridine-5-carboxymethylaminomethyl(34) synthesis GTPase MnmE [Devosia albogilva]|uniref:tRNA modification GTPase MnmE n=1 Tax=Devosia albogilva TaxID=429726 RepID=A0ABW5QKF5_9HYPH